MSVNSASIPRSQYLHQSYPFPFNCLTLLSPLLCFLPFDPTKPSALFASTAMSLAHRPVIAVPSSVTEFWCEYAFDRDNCWPCTSGRAERCEPPEKNGHLALGTFVPLRNILTNADVCGRRRLHESAPFISALSHPGYRGFLFPCLLEPLWCVPRCRNVKFFFRDTGRRTVGG